MSWSSLNIAAFVLASIVAVSITAMPEYVAPIIARVPHVREHVQAWWTDRWIDCILRAQHATSAGERDLAIEEGSAYLSAAHVVATESNDGRWLYYGFLGDATARGVDWGFGAASAPAPEPSPTCDQ